MSYTALYRKFRPATFADVKGQEHIVTTLRNQIAAGRIGHAYLFTGTRGTGKTTVAKIVARMVNCEHPTQDGPCGECHTCKAIASGASMNVIEIDAASNNGVDNIREIVDEVAYSPAEGKYKVYIIDEVHMLSTGAFNALLKTLEEPPSYVIFILATTEVHKIPATILSRCQRYDFKRISLDTITDRLRELTEKEGVAAEEKALRYVAKVADGSMRDALSLLDQCIAFHIGQELTMDKALDVLGAVDTTVFSRLLRCVIQKDVSACISLLEEVVMQGRELVQFVNDFVWYLRNLMLVQTSDKMEEVVDMSSDNLKLLKEEAGLLDLESVIRYIRIFSELSNQIRYATQKRILVEIALIKLCRPQMEEDYESVLDRVRQVEERLDRGDFIVQTQSIPQEEVGKKKEKPKLPAAVSEDVQRIASQWVSIIDGAEGMLKAMLKKSVISLSNDNKLMLVSEGTVADFFAEEAHREAVKELLCEFIQKEVEILFERANSKREQEESYINLEKDIQFDIEIADEEDE